MAICILNSVTVQQTPYGLRAPSWEYVQDAFLSFAGVRGRSITESVGRPSTTRIPEGDDLFLAMEKDMGRARPTAHSDATTIAEDILRTARSTFDKGHRESPFSCDYAHTTLDGTIVGAVGTPFFKVAGTIKQKKDGQYDLIFSGVAGQCPLRWMAQHCTELKLGLEKIEIVVGFENAPALEELAFDFNLVAPSIARLLGIECTGESMVQSFLYGRVLCCGYNGMFYDQPLDGWEQSFSLSSRELANKWVHYFPGTVAVKPHSSWSLTNGTRHEKVQNYPNLERKDREVMNWRGEGSTLLLPHTTVCGDPVTPEITMGLYREKDDHRFFLGDPAYAVMWDREVEDAETISSVLAEEIAKGHGLTVER